jgi:ATP-dependent DNA helicase DinG
VLYIADIEIEPNSPEYPASVAEISAEIISHLGGNCMILFTSYRMLKDVRERLSNMIVNTIYAQGEYPAQEVIERYIGDDGSVLLGTHSFWQGIDLPGDLLRGVIITRLPFSVPDRPLVQARVELMENSGMNPFYSLHIPEAIIRFKQGFGRLIRSRDDRGVVAVLDSRIISRNYGKLFLKSIPECATVYTLDDFRAALP